MLKGKPVVSKPFTKKIDFQPTVVSKLGQFVFQGIDF